MPKQWALDDLISHIGFGRYHLRLLALCGLGWWNDSMWFQVIATVLPRLQVQFAVDDRLVGVFASSFFIGMALGAFSWGACADRFGRLPVFNITLLWTTVVGVAVAFSPSFLIACVLVALLGFGVGGNMPVDGALFIEFIPREQQYMFSMLSVFFAFGGSYTSGLAWALIPRYSCVAKQGSYVPLDPNCDLKFGNAGWRYVLFIVALTNALMFLARILLIKIEESPRFLLGQGRNEEAAKVLRHIARMNGKATLAEEILPESLRFAPGSDEVDELTTIVIEEDEKDQDFLWNKTKSLAGVPTWRLLFGRKWIMTTLLVWAIWIVESFAFNSFGQLLPKYFEAFKVETPGFPRNAQLMSLDEVYRDFFVYSLSSIPGPIVATWLAESRLGRRGTMVLAASFAAATIISFSFVKIPLWIVLNSVAISFFISISYTTLFTYTPEVFETRVRGLATGTAGAFGRISGIVAPALATFLFSIDTRIPLYVSGGLFGVSALLMALLPIETRGRVVV